MADTTLRADCALSKRADETWQEFADRMLAVHRVTGEPVAPAAPKQRLTREAFDKLEAANVDLGYVRSLCHAVMDAVEDVHDMVAPGGACANNNLRHFTSRAINLLCLQLDKVEDTDRGVTAAIDGWLL